MSEHILALENVSKRFGSVLALQNITMRLKEGEVHCLLGDNGAGKSTLIKTLAGVHKPTDGQYLVDGKPVVFNSPSEALDMGVATVYQDLALVPLLSVARNFFMGREPMKKLLGLVPVMDIDYAAETARAKLAEMGIMVRDPHQAIGTMSGGEKQCLAIARAIHFGARVLILDEPTAALGVKQSFNVLKLIYKARERGISVIFITHNVHHAYPVGDSFTLLNRGKSLGTFTKDTVTKDALLDMMAGGAEMQTLMAELDGVTI
ncbi:MULTISPECIES: ATP-binding cassette domain-containing protein [Janthinobacterium]|uniref:ATP-binding cassette domain-containing protein n=1 Tax=Janthinobacterium violaceinigrum TaxID=2654252 RepID=A0A6I1I042_9BURK|nr:MULTISPECIES: ATP-binding cassette domain-containing protein [Janthinobacterium]KAB8061923.1 ATP-binding cassette domain-containing protein [Janthinobacterium sp. FT14W]KAB8064294.1 ATP-binding cassette domain-containing protein [Janthinobacterium violaceinigrum]MED5596538.1 ATP-binding cassette domain-containing protein [Janthinobacterium sp. P210006]